MRTTISLDEQLLKEAKLIAVASHKTLSEVVADSLRETIARRRANSPRKRIKLHTFKGEGIQPGVDMSSYSALLDFMDDYDGRPGR